VGARIKALRDAKELTQQQLASAAVDHNGEGVHETAVSHWEKGVSLPDVKRLPAIAKTLDVTVAALIEGEPAYSALGEMLEAMAS